MLTNVNCATLDGIAAKPINVEVNMTTGGSSFTINGMPEAAARESKIRVKHALKNSGYAIPPRKMTVDLTSDDTFRNGSAFDMAISLGILAGVGLIDEERLREKLVIGELDLDGRCRPVPGALPYALLARRQGNEELMIAADNATEASVVSGIHVIPVQDLHDAVMHLTGERSITPCTPTSTKPELDEIDMSDIRGLDNAKRALEIAAAGGHNILITGPPGSGKTMLARRLTTILPPLTYDEMIEASTVHSVIGLTNANRPLVASRPFRAPHHTVSNAGLIGGGSPARPGEVSLAHNGILFLDELPEFRIHTLEVLREPLNDRMITIYRSDNRTTFPADFSLVASMNPCPCGYHDCTRHDCSCTPAMIERYQTQIPTPLLDQIDLHVDIPEMTDDCHGETSATIRKRVIAAREIQRERFVNTPIRTNNHMTLRETLNYCEVDELGRKMIGRLPTLSALAFGRILKLARTIADLEESETIKSMHLVEALAYSNLSRTF